MRIGIDCRTILNPKRGERAGVGHYSYYLVKNILKQDKRNEYVLFFDYRFQNTHEFKQKNVKIRCFPFSQYKKFLPFSYSHMLIAAFLKREKLDLYHSPANVIPYYYNGPSVVTVHDLAIYRHPEWFPRGQKFSISVLVPRSLNKALRLIAVSEATKKDIVKVFKVPQKKIQVVYEGVLHETTKTTDLAITHKHGIKGKYLLYVGTIEPRKNLVLLVRAFSKLVKKSKAMSKYTLVLAGHRGWKSDKIFKEIKKQGLEEQVKYLDYVSHEDKLALMKHATVFVFPTLYEGFGLPVLEAMNQGTPVISSNASSVPEVTGSAAVLVNPKSETALTEAMKKVLSSSASRKKLGRNGIEQAKKFRWSKCAKETIQIYREEFKKLPKKKKPVDKPSKSARIKKLIPRFRKKKKS
ncbi:glycosyltransferase family 4 protein [Patescibacteria group bacterium]|nr:glycosyltransferase family 4 protein [Patescibacteria group bacterium]MBU1890013.1 glycosyltransferase family 4 protein [Patescibacteria group bacterium]